MSGTTSVTGSTTTLPAWEGSCGGIRSTFMGLEPAPASLSPAPFSPLPMTSATLSSSPALSGWPLHCCPPFFSFSSGCGGSVFFATFSSDFGGCLSGSQNSGEVATSASFMSANDFLFSISASVNDFFFSISAGGKEGS